MKPTRTALLVTVPEAEPAVSSSRATLDPAAELGVPAHITVFYPFVSPDELTDEVELQLARLAGAQDAFDFQLTEVRTFPDLGWLHPEPAGPFAHLTQTVSDRFELLPYEGEHDEAIPHLTVGHGQAALDPDLHAQWADHLPLSSRATSVELWVGGPCGWARKERFPLRQTVATTERLRLRTWDPDADAEAIFGVWGRAETMQFVDGELASSAESVARGLSLGNRVHGRTGHCLWAVVLKTSGEVIGDCGFHPVDDRPGLELGYHLDHRHWGRGLATEAVRGAVEYGFEVLAAPAIHAWVAPGNAASVRVLEKLGFAEGAPEENERYFRRERSPVDDGLHRGSATRLHTLLE